MNFYNFMTRHHINDAGPVGRLAKDMQSDRERFPKNGQGKFAGWKAIIRRYLEGQEASDNCLWAFDEAWEEYVRCEKKRLNQNLPLR